MKARRLRILRIDDTIPLVRKEGNSLGMSALSLRPPRGLDLEVVRKPKGQTAGIDSWDTAIWYWSTLKGFLVTDLIAADVRFDKDATSPLNAEGATRDIPTGLSHLKGFAAVARAVGAPIGIALHTSDPNIWRKLRNDKSDLRNLTLGLLAAHEIGEVAAMLADATELLELSREDQLEWCWRWLATHAADDFETTGYKVALKDYRRRFVRSAQIREGAFPEVMVLPSAWLRLVRWCEDIQNNPRPLGRDDPGLEFVLANGQSDSVQLRSIFADARLDLEVDNLPAQCFDLTPATPSGRDVDAWSLSTGELPRIGAFMSAVRVLHDVVELAWSTLENHVRLELDPKARLTGNLRDWLDGGSDKIQFARGLTVLFQVLRCQAENFRRWEVGYREYLWNIRTRTFSDLRDAHNSLASWLSRLHRLLGGDKNWFDLEDKFEDHEWGEGNFVTSPIPEYVLWHVDLLMASGVVIRNEISRRYKSTGRKLTSVPPLPASLPQGLDLLAGGSRSQLPSYLRDTLGFGGSFGPGTRDNDNAVGQEVSKAFLDSDAVAGREFLVRFLEGDGPMWLKELCRDVVVSKLGWTDAATWPRALR